MKSSDIMKTLSYQYNQLSLHEKLDLVPPDANEPGNAALSEKKKLTRKALNFAQKHGLPKRPAHSGFGIYISERLIGAKGKTLADVANKLKELSSIWNLFSSSEKQAYSDRATERHQAYLKDVQAWAALQKLATSSSVAVLVRRFYARHKRLLKLASKRRRRLVSKNRVQLASTVALHENVSMAQTKTIGGKTVKSRTPTSNTVRPTVPLDKLSAKLTD